MIAAALEHSNHKLRTKSLLSMLTHSSLFRKEENFYDLCPVYNITPQDIELYLKQKLLDSKK